MRDKFKKLTSVAIAGTMAFATVALSACGDKNYKGTALDGFDAAATVTDNGGFAVKKGDYVYFINGQEDYTAENKYGEVTKGALMRIKSSDLTSGQFGNAQTVVPMLFSAQNFDAGIYIYGDRVYYATPTTDKDLDGKVANDWIDFKSAKLDGSETMKGNYFRLENNDVQYRFVQVNNVVYCVYVDDGNLYSYNTQSGKKQTLVEGASNYYFDESDAENANVYYTMSVTNNIDSDNATTASYNQIYSVNAAATATVSEANGKVSYSVYSDGDTSKEAYRTYSFDKSYMEEKNDEAKKEDKKAKEVPYDFKDYTTMPYVNLGKLVLDGVGSAAEINQKTQYNDVDAGTNENEPYGYTYTIQSYENGGLYFTRKNNTFAATKLYYVANTAVAEATWKSVAGNASVTYITDNTTNASTSAVYYKTTDNKLAYIYIEDGKIVREIGAEKVIMEESASSATLWMVEDGFLYYTEAGSNGNTLFRINVNGEKSSYNLTWGDEEYHKSAFAFVDFNSAWYMPEIIDNVLLFSNAESFGSYSYNYIWAFNMNGANGLMTAAELNAVGEKYDEAKEKISEVADGDADVDAVLNYVFRTGKVDKYTAIKNNDEYFDDDQRNAIKTFVEDTTASYRQSYFVSMVGAYKTADSDAIDSYWTDYVTPDVEEEETTQTAGLKAWQIILIIVSGVIVGAGIGGMIAYFIYESTKKKEAAARANQVANAYKKRIDVTDDKSVDVYSDDEEETVEEATQTQETVEETVEEVVEAPVEETATESEEEAKVEE